MWTRSAGARPALCPSLSTPAVNRAARFPKATLDVQQGTACGPQGKSSPLAVSIQPIN